MLTLTVSLPSLPYTFKILAKALAFVFVFVCLPEACAQAVPVEYTPFNPPAYPLTVRSPYLNAWLRQGPNPSQPGAEWPTFWSTAGHNVSPRGSSKTRFIKTALLTL